MRTKHRTLIFLITTSLLLFPLTASTYQSANHPANTSRARYLKGLTDGWRFAKDLSILSGGPSSARSCAQDHAQQMAKAGTIWHSTCSYSGEIVGAGPGGRSLFKAWYRSKPHRRIMKHPTWEWSVWAVVYDGYSWYAVGGFS